MKRHLLNPHRAVKPHRLSVVAGLAALVCLATAPFARADYWILGGVGDWNAATNWSGGVVPNNAGGWAGGVYVISGTIGQPDAGTMSGGGFTLTGGFWGIVAAVQTDGAPYLSVTRCNAAVLVSWPKADPAWKLEFTTHLGTDGTNIWTLLPPPYPTNASDCVVTEPAPVGNEFYRLYKP